MTEDERVRVKVRDHFEQSQAKPFQYEMERQLAKLAGRMTTRELKNRADRVNAQMAIYLKSKLNPTQNPI